MNRRSLLSTAVAAAAGLGATSVAVKAASDEKRTFVLVHGAWHGGWCWSRVAPRLRAAGHRVFTPTLTGLGERSHLISTLINLDTHVADIASVIEAEELEGVVLVGHSYAGTIISGVAERMPARLRQLVYLDAQVLQSGTSLFGNLPEQAVAQRLKTVRETGGGVGTAPLAPAVFGVTDPGDVAWLERRMTLQPIGTYTQTFVLRQPLGNGVPKTYIECTSTPIAALEPFKRQVRDSKEWVVRPLASGHDAMVVASEALSNMLLEIAG